MPKYLIVQFVSWLSLCLTAFLPTDVLAADPAQDPVRITFKRAAVATFLVGRHKPQLDQTADQTLSCPIVQICADDPTILPHAGITLTRLVDKQLRGRFGQQVIPRADVQNAEDEIKLNREVDTPRLIAEKLGHNLDIDVVILGTVWRYRDRGAVTGLPDSPASVAFAVYMVDAASGRILWRGLFDETQQALFDNVLDAKKNLKMGLKWLTANELAEFGVKEVFSKFPPNILPGDYAGEKQ